MKNISSIPKFKTSKERRAFWFSHITAWRSSSKSQRQYCEDHGLKLFTFCYWRRVHAPKTKPVSLPFIKVTPKSETPTMSSAVPKLIQLKLSNGIIANIPFSIGTAEIIRLLQGLGGADVKVSV